MNSTTDKPTQQIAKPQKDNAKQERLAKALRQNLLRRKEAARPPKAEK